MSPETRAALRRGWSPDLVAIVVMVLAALTLFWPMLGGAFLAGPHSDQYIAGYGFRLFGAQAFRETGSIPLWNPYILGGLPFVGAMHGDIYYPTAWLRWVLPTGVAMDLGFFIGVVSAGWFSYRLLRALKVSIPAAIVGGLAYELTGMTASLVQPGHDGKLYVAAITPLLFLGLLRAIRDRRRSGFGVTALAVGLALLGHPQVSYYLLVAAGLWAVHLVFFDPERPSRSWLAAGGALASALGAVILGIGIYAVQLLPALEYLPYSPRGSGGPSGGWEYAIGFSLPPAELFATILPQFNGVLASYAGQNGIKLHTEHLGVTVLLLAILGWGIRGRARLRHFLAGLGTLFLLVSLGGHTPFYRLWYEVMPMMKTVRAPGMAFFLVSFCITILAALGADRLFQQESPSRIGLRWIVPFAALGMLGVFGGLQPIAEALAPDQLLPVAIANAGSLRLDSLRLLVMLGSLSLVLWLLRRQRLRLGAVVGLTGLIVFADLWSVDRRFFTFSPPTAVTYADDPLTATMKKAPLPWRVWDPAGGYAQYGVYRGKSFLMAYNIPTLLGYHGNELRYFDALLGGKNVWSEQLNPNILNLYAVRYVVLAQPTEMPGYHQIAGPSRVATGGEGVLYEADSPPPWVRVVPGAVKLSESQIVPTVVDPRFPVDQALILSDSGSGGVVGSVPASPAAVVATLTEWRAGRMRVALSGKSDSPTYLLIAENWYPDWWASVDGVATPTQRANGAMLSVELPAGAREVVLEFHRSRQGSRGRQLSLLSLLGALALLAWPRRKSAPRAVNG